MNGPRPPDSDVTGNLEKGFRTTPFAEKAGLEAIVRVMGVKVHMLLSAFDYSRE